MKKLHAVEEAVEQAVNRACRELRWYADDVRKIIRAEIDPKTLDELRAAAGHGYDHLPWHAFMNGEGPLEVRGVAYYAIERLPVAWRVVAPTARGAVILEPKSFALQVAGTAMDKDA